MKYTIEKSLEIIREFENIVGIEFDGEIKINNRLSRSLGRALALKTRKNGVYSYRPIGIELSKKFLEVATEEEFRDVLAHEFAHYCTYTTYGDHNHNTYVFINYCKKLQADYAPTMRTQNVVKRKYDVHCSCCGKYLAGYGSKSSNVIRTGGLGYTSKCCKKQITITQNW